LGAEISAGLGTLRRAIADRRKIRFAYARADGEDNARTARPLGLYFWGSSWSLAAWCELRGDFRSFRPDRMSDLEVLPGVSDVDGDVSLRGFVAEMQRRVAEEDAHEAARG